MCKVLFLSIALAGAISAAAPCDTIIVPDEYTTIQGAINAAAAGDTILVRPGTYFENVDYSGKDVVIRSDVDGNAVTVDPDPGVTIIDGGQSGSVVIFQSGESRAAMLEGFTVTNGSGNPAGLNRGGGIYCKDSAPTITGNVVVNNISAGGGGVYCCGSSALIEGNLFDSNDGGSTGGGVSGEDGSATVIGNTITNNHASIGGAISGLWVHPFVIRDNTIVGNQGASGGGINCSTGCEAEVIGNVIRNNVSQGGSGGGIRFHECNPSEIAGNWIEGNSEDKNGGGGINCNQCHPVTIRGNVFVGNTTSGSKSEGGGLKCSASEVIVNNLFYGNSGLYGAGILCDGNPSLTNNTFHQNTAGSAGGAVYCRNTSTDAQLVNCVLWGNSAPSGPQLAIAGTSYLAVSHSDLEGGKSAVRVDTGATLDWGAGNIDADPLFFDPSNGDYHLTSGSPCRNAGDNAAVAEPTDFEGDPRVTGSTVDMGADEFWYHLYHVGDVLPGGSISIRTVGIPGKPVLLALGSGIQDPPQSTQYGELWLLMPLVSEGKIGTIPSSGILNKTVDVPGGWLLGSEHPFQALVGPKGNPNSRLTNLMVLRVE